MMMRDPSIPPWVVSGRRIEAAQRQTLMKFADQQETA
jgi:hypothetical protein